MSDKEEYKNALRIVANFEASVNRSVIKERTCICCKKNVIKPLGGMGLAEGAVDPVFQEQGCWDGGTVEKISFGYGSNHDMSSFFMAICDDCVVQLHKDGLIVSAREIEKQIKNLKE